MNLEFFIAKRIVSTKLYKNSVSAPIIKIGIAAIAIGIIVMLIAIATGLGLQQKIRDKIVAFNGHIQITYFDNNTSDDSQVPISKQQPFYPSFNTIKGVSHIQAVATKFAVMRTKNDFEGVVIKGVGADYNWAYFEDFLVQGQLPNYKSKRNQDVLVSQYIANRLQLNVGDKVQTLFGQNFQKKPRLMAFTIVGIYNSGFQELDQKFCIADIRHIQRLNKWSADQVGSFEVFIDNYNNLDAVVNQVYHQTDSMLNAQSITKKYYTVFEWIKVFDKNTYGIIVIMIIVAGINMITALLVLILERTQMIGLLKALGSSNWRIRKIFLYNASYLIGLGLFWGNLIGLTLLFIQHYFGVLQFPNPKDYYISQIPVYISFNIIALLNIGTFITCLIMLIVPSVIITKIAPIKAMRFN